MLNQNEESLLNRLTDGEVSSIFRTVYGFLPSDAVAKLGTYLRQLVTKPREVLVESTNVAALTINATAAVNSTESAGPFGTIAIDSELSKTIGRQWTLISVSGCAWTALGNIAVAGACPAFTSVTFTYNPTTEKWYPSKVA